jgi:hypothetical protein
MLPISSASESPSRVDVRLMALAVPAPGLAPDALARFDWVPRLETLEAVMPPYVWQHGKSLFLLDRTISAEWVVAEFRYDRLSGCYHERARMVYDWPREALGALLGRILIHGEAEIVEAAATLDAWWGHVSAYAS